MTNKTRKLPERRRHHRFSLVEGLIEPVTVRFDGSSREGCRCEGRERPVRGVEQPAILTNLSAGGMSMVCFAEPPRARRLDMVLTLPGLKSVPIVGRVARMHQKGQTWNVGIAFTLLSPKHRNMINGMAQDNLDCETRISLNLPDSCAPKCAFHHLCVKPQKVSQYWKGKTH
ncbi:MAG: PilZ domain-containing protein [Elusimicrobia bacterium]|nr:PilZ domain-containing protein [Elusimicrobiota bacterium]